MKEKKQTAQEAQDETDDFYFASPEEQDQGIETKDHENGSSVKRLTLSDGKRAVIRKLKGRDFVETKKRVQNDNSLDFETANMAVAITIDGKQEPPEFYLDDLYQNDYAKLMIAYGALNFQ